jgi:hypothetical protein
LPVVDGLRFTDLCHGREPGWFAETRERERRASVLGDFVTSNERHRFFGIVEPGKHDGEEFDLPVIESVRTLRRLSPDDELNFHIVAEITQRVRRNRRWFFGGSTVVIDEDGFIRYVVGKGIRNQARHEATNTFLARAPQEYRDAFEQDVFDRGALMRRFHARAARRRRR